ncbi:unnamed protein product [Cyprideis torosa]|uniref:Uncharacterized protein n=1 Tax=Cyprideis torosa TaxID=163714 RepID=A0A7R8W5Q2_9CRUS|nr:unnamed protein product [Cyprideis torosa]CAG0880088.1 unnamed protein product [Cyprideis torosa]
MVGMFLSPPIEQNIMESCKTVTESDKMDTEVDEDESESEAEGSESEEGNGRLHQKEMEENALPAPLIYGEQSSRGTSCIITLKLDKVLDQSV